MSNRKSDGEEVADWPERDALRAWAKPPRRLVVACH
jgi:hypothetical protein